MARDALFLKNEIILHECDKPCAWRAWPVMCLERHCEMHFFVESNMRLYLEDLLHITCHIIMLLADDSGVKHTGCGIQRVHGRVDTQLSNWTRQHSGGVQVSKGCSRCRICQIICWHVDGLHEKSVKTQYILHETDEFCNPHHCVQMPMSCTVLSHLHPDFEMWVSRSVGQSLFYGDQCDVCLSRWKKQGAFDKEYCLGSLGNCRTSCGREYLQVYVWEAVSYGSCNTSYVIIGKVKRGNTARRDWALYRCLMARPSLLNLQALWQMSEQSVSRPHVRRHVKWTSRGQVVSEKEKEERWTRIPGPMW